MFLFSVSANSIHEVINQEEKDYKNLAAATQSDEGAEEYVAGYITRKVSIDLILIPNFSE